MKEFFRCCDGDEAAEQEAEEIDKQEREERDDANAIATSDAKHRTEVALGPLFRFPPLWISLHPSTKDFHPCLAEYLHSFFPFLVMSFIPY
jgi:hypothetical protein